MEVKINAIEYYLPPKIETNQTLLADNPDWQIKDIEAKTGISSRHIAEPEQTALDLAIIAGNNLFNSGVNPKEINFLIFITQSPDYILPTSACVLQDKLGLNCSCMAFDVNLGCSGFVYGLSIGGALIEAGIAKQGLLICGDTYSKYIAKNDRTCRSIFGDGASATHLISSKDSNLGPFEMGTDGSGYQNLIVPNSGARKSSDSEVVGQLYMDGASIFMFTMDMVPRCITALLNKAKLQVSDIDLFIFHQASKLVIDSIIRRIDLPEEKVFVNYSKIGNTVSSSIPIALKDAAKENKLKPGDRIMLVGFGVGYSWGSCLINWDMDL